MFQRIRTIRGHRYRYLEKRWREGGRVRSQSRSLGPVDGALVSGQPTNLGHGGYLEQMAQYPAKENGPDKAGAEVAGTAQVGAIPSDSEE